MRIGIITDSACDLPNDFIDREQIVILPVTIQIGQAILADTRNEEATMSFLTGETAERAFEAETTPYTVQQVHDLFLGKLVHDYDYVFCITTTRTRSGIHDNAVQASYSILNDYKPIRAQSGNTTPFALRVIDSQNVFAAVGVLVVEAVRMRAAGETPPKIRAHLESLASNIQGYMVPPDLHYLRNRIKKRGDKSVSFFSAALGTALDIKPILHCNKGDTGPVAKVKGFNAATEKMFDFACKQVRAGLLTPTMSLSYGGDLNDMRKLPGYDRLRATCTEHNVEVFESFMGLSGLVNVGKGAIVLAFAAEPRKFD
ncbi:DegV family protein [Thermomonas sp.]|uniref:DegV family protein n=1 Tax=Thermomonas sp. TaxID=1971895 RepID=UPI002599C392|nr:DegV family protein [Thermomonas sp.]HOC10347.1 DegV family protein [Thermomonas sp.]HQA01648.1 DegV family protein [Thermomonas sp.]HQE07589.1 DegV family protein [Thermomonas sp.]